jgi:hypothetical protein
MAPAVLPDNFGDKIEGNGKSVNVFFAFFCPWGMGPEKRSITPCLKQTVMAAVKSGTDALNHNKRLANGPLRDGCHLMLRANAFKLL